MVIRELNQVDSTRSVLANALSANGWTLENSKSCEG